MARKKTNPTLTRLANCTLCGTPPGDVVFQDERMQVVLHQDWSPRGHAMVVARRHIENASDLDEADWLHLARVWHHAERVLLEATGAERAIILKLGIMTPHLHVHIYPVSGDATREAVFAAIDGKAPEHRDKNFVTAVRDGLKAQRLSGDHSSSL